MVHHITFKTWNWWMLRLSLVVWMGTCWPNILGWTFCVWNSDFYVGAGMDSSVAMVIPSHYSHTVDEWEVALLWRQGALRKEDGTSPACLIVVSITSQHSVWWQWLFSSQARCWEGLCWCWESLVKTKHTTPGNYPSFSYSMAKLPKLLNISYFYFAAQHLEGWSQIQD